MNGTMTSLVTNGNFNADAANWTAANSAALAAVGSGQSGNCLQITNSGGNPGQAYQDITVIAGRYYMVELWFKAGTSPGGVVRLGTPSDPSKFCVTSTLTAGSWTKVSLGANMGSDTTLRLSLENATGDGQTCFFDQVSAYRITNGLMDILNNSAMYIYSGSRPASADNQATGTLLATIPNLSFGSSSNAVLSKNPAETWTALASSSGTAGWGCLVEGGGTPGNASTTEARIFFTVGTSGAECNLNTTALVASGAFSVNSCSFTFPLGT